MSNYPMSPGRVAQQQQGWESTYESTGQLPPGYDPSQDGEASYQYEAPTLQQLQQYESSHPWEQAEEDEEDDDPEDSGGELPPPPSETYLHPPPMHGLPPPPPVGALPPLPSAAAPAVAHGPATSPSMKVEGRLFMKSTEALPWKGWLPCAFTLIGDKAHYYTEDGQHSGVLDLANLRLVGTKGIKDVPAGKSAFLLTVGEQKFACYGDDQMQYIIWHGIFQNFAKKKPKQVKKAPSTPLSSSSSGKNPRRASSKKVGKKSSATTAVIDLVKSRLGEYGKDVNRPTYRFLQLLYDARPTFINAIFAITQQADADKVAGYLARIFYFVDRAHYLIRNVTNFEVAMTMHENTLFRQNSLASKIMTAYSRIVAQQYLTDLLKPVVDKVISLGRKLEVQPDKLNEVERGYLPEHRDHVREVVMQVLDRIRDSLDVLPVECRQICHDLKDEVQRKFPNAVDISIAGYLFLRLINPALVVPDSIGIVPSNSLSADNRRGLLVVSKIILNIANKVEFKKEEYMMEFNQWTRDRFEIMKSFYEQAAEIPANPPPKHEIKVEPLNFLEEVARLYKILYFNSEKLFQQLGHDSKLAKEFKACIDGIGAPDSTNQPPPTMTAGTGSSGPSGTLSPSSSRASLNVSEADRKRAGVFSRLAEAITHFFRPTKDDSDAPSSSDQKRASTNPQ